jgi:hypothetical protein
MRWYIKIELELREVSIYNAYVFDGCVTDHDKPNKKKKECK